MERLGGRVSALVLASRLDLAAASELADVRGAGIAERPLGSGGDVWALPVLALVVAGVLGVVAARRIYRKRTRAQVHENDARPVPSTESKDGEIEVLTAAFHRMLRSLDVAHAEAIQRSKLTFLGEIAGNVAHEIRTPLSVLKAAAQLLGRPGTDPQRQHDLVTTIVSEVDRLNAVVTDLVELARPAAVSYQREALATIVVRAATFFSAAAEEAGVYLGHEVDAENLSVRCSPDQLHQVLLNLIGNALQAVGRAGSIRIRCRRDGRCVLLQVEDSGPGIRADLLSRIFSPFFTTRPGGTGLGLAICKRIVEEHGGTIGAENCGEGGARFTVRLPLCE
jgi:signal transduction histidine kinase